jgi:hypothetical protein
MTATQANIALAVAEFAPNSGGNAGVAVAEFAKNSGSATRSSAFQKMPGTAQAAAFEERGRIPAMATQVAMLKWFASSVGPSASGPHADGVRATLVAR